MYFSTTFHKLLEQCPSMAFHLICCLLFLWLLFSPTHQTLGDPEKSSACCLPAAVSVRPLTLARISYRQRMWFPFPTAIPPRSVLPCPLRSTASEHFKSRGHPGLTHPGEETLGTWGSTKHPALSPHRWHDNPTYTYQKPAWSTHCSSLSNQRHQQPHASPQLAPSLSARTDFSKPYVTFRMDHWGPLPICPPTLLCQQEKRDSLCTSHIVLWIEEIYSHCQCECQKQKSFGLNSKLVSLGRNNAVFN